MPRNRYWMLKELRKAPEKVVFLNDKNLEAFKGYKAYVQVTRQNEIHISLTGLSKKCSTALFDKLEALNPNDIASDNK